VIEICWSGLATGIVRATGTLREITAKAVIVFHICRVAWGIGVGG